VGSGRLSLLLSLMAASVALLATDAAFALETTCPPEESFEDDLLAATCTPAAASPCPETGSDAGVADTSVGVSETAISGAQIRLRPWKLRPGDLFEVEARGDQLRSAAATFAGDPVPMFQVGPGLYRGYGGVPIDTRLGLTLVHIAVVGSDGKPRSGSVPMELVERSVIKKTIRVDNKFTSPSAKQAAQMKEDQKALIAAYRVPFGPPHFEGRFVDPLGHERGSRFGERRMFNGATKSRHWGLDIDGDAGEPVRASNAGVVALARPCFMSGLTVIVSHGAGLFTGYFHFSKFAVKTGQRVQRGDVLGYVGSTGRSTGPHLHFAAKLHRVLIDPEALLEFDFAPSNGVDSARDAGFAPDTDSDAGR